MPIFIKQELCNGCGTCVDACPNGAISLMAGKAKIEESLCTSCEACVSLCPVEAIRKETIPAPTIYIPETSRVPDRAIQIPRLAVSQASPRYPRFNSLLERLGFALFSLGREMLPYFAEGLTTALEQRIASPRVRNVTSSVRPAVRRDLNRAGRNLQQQRRRRIRRGHNL
jgi:NAD-dependent dihydropyrimidine dehydrogenase PreA subunit